MRRRFLVLLSAVALLLSGCTEGSGGDATPTPDHPTRTITVQPQTLPDGVGLSFIQQRLDEGTRRAQVRIVNGTDEAVRVRAVGVAWAGFPDGTQPARTRVEAGRVLDVRYRLPDPDCSTRAGSAPMGGVVVAADRTIRRPMADDGRRFLRRLWRTECDARRVARTVRVTFDLPTDLAATATGEGLDTTGRLALVLRREGRPGGPNIEVEQVQGSVLFELALDEVASLAPHERGRRFGVSLGPGRCDEHGRSQSTQTFTWRVWLAWGDADPIVVVVVPTARQQRELLDWLDRACDGITAH